MEPNRIQSIGDLLNARTSGLMGHQPLRRSAVLVPLIERNGEVHVLLEQRPRHLRNHPGEICFPGGRCEEGEEDAELTSIRETCEELGVTPERIEVIGKLDRLVGNTEIIHPFVGRILGQDEFRPNPSEVEEVFSIPLEHLLTTGPKAFQMQFKVVPPDDFPYDDIPGGREYKWRHGKYPTYFYYYENRVVWGITGRILYHFLELIRAT
jgi:peroxisomal coenzyme A diphosphatase NUDT7